jgi:pyrroloquinoline quinone (PQQ) biosynthesis protein C
MSSADPRQRRSALPSGKTEARHTERLSVQAPVTLRVGDRTEFHAHTQDIASTGIRFLSPVAIRAGIPVTIQCSFGGFCYLNLSGQTIFSMEVAEQSQRLYSMGLKFSAIRDFERKVLRSAVEELRDNSEARERSWFAISISQDALALEAANFGQEQLDKADDSEPRLNDAAGKRRRRHFTPDPTWVMEMNQYLEPFRQAIWNCNLVQETSVGKLSLRQVRGWCIQFYPFIEYFPQFMATYLAKAPDAVSRKFLIDNLRVEKRHADQWIDMALGFGLPKVALFTTPILPEVEALTHWLWSITNRGSFTEAVAATNYAIEGVTQGIAAIMVKGFPKYHGRDGVVLERRAYYWMEAHSAYDDLHPVEALELIKAHAVSPELQERVKHAARRSLEYLHLALEACYAAYVEEQVSVGHISR